MIHDDCVMRLWRECVYLVTRDRGTRIYCLECVRERNTHRLVDYGSGHTVEELDTGGCFVWYS